MAVQILSPNPKDRSNLADGDNSLPGSKKQIGLFRDFLGTDAGIQWFPVARSMGWDTNDEKDQRAWQSTNDPTVYYLPAYNNSISGPARKDFFVTVRITPSGAGPGTPPPAPVLGSGAGRLVQFSGSPAVYTVGSDGRTLAHVQGVQVATAQWGPQWNTQVSQLPAGSQGNYILIDFAPGGLVQFLGDARVWSVGPDGKTLTHVMDPAHAAAGWGQNWPDKVIKFLASDMPKYNLVDPVGPQAGIAGVTWELTVFNGGSEAFTAKSAQESADPQGPHPGASYPDWNTLALGRRPQDFGLPKRLVAWQEDTGQWRPAQQEFQSLMQAAQMPGPRQQYAQAVLQSIGVTSPGGGAGLSGLAQELAALGL